MLKRRVNCKPTYSLPEQKLSSAPIASSTKISLWKFELLVAIGTTREPASQDVRKIQDTVFRNQDRHALFLARMTECLSGFEDDKDENDSVVYSLHELESCRPNISTSMWCQLFRREQIKKARTHRLSAGRFRHTTGGEQRSGGNDKDNVIAAYWCMHQCAEP